MDEGILEVSEVAGDRVDELRVVELHGFGLITCKVGGIVQGDEGPVGGVAQVIGCHGVIVAVGHQEEGQDKEGEKQGEVEGEVEEKLKDNRTSWMIWRWSERQVRAALSHVECDE